MLFYPAALPLSSRTLNYVAGVIRRHRRKIGSPWRKLAPGRQALLVLAYLGCHRNTAAPLDLMQQAAANGIAEACADEPEADMEAGQ